MVYLCGGIACHNHTDKSNIRLLDSTNRTKDLIKTAAEVGYKGLAITDHECLSAHVEAIKLVREMKKPKKKQPAELPEDFKLILGNEIYLVDSLESVKDNYKSGETKFPHFLLLAKDKEGHEQLRKLSSQAWKNSFYTGTMERTPTTKEYLKEIVTQNPNHLIASSACLGSEINIYLLEAKKAENNSNVELADNYRVKIDSFVSWCIDIFGKENFFIELQPALSEEQIYCNQKLIQIAEYYGLKMIVTTDSHYLRPEDRIIHKAFLNSKDGEREVDDFYEACFLQSQDKIYDRMSYIESSIIKEAIQNTLLIGEAIEDYTIEHEPIIPKIDLPNFEVRDIFKPGYEKYTYIDKIANSSNEQDRYLMKLLEDGFEEKLLTPNLTSEEFHSILGRLDIELGELWEIGQKLNQSMPSQELNCY